MDLREKYLKVIKTEREKRANIELERFKEYMSNRLGDEGEILSRIIYCDDVYSDLSRVQFDLENISCTPGDFIDGGGRLLGFKEVDGFPFLGIIAGGDWEIGVFFIVYYDKKTDKLRGYVPYHGNLFNRDTSMAYGNAEEDCYIRIESAIIDSIKNYRITYDYNMIIEDIRRYVDIRS